MLETFLHNVVRVDIPAGGLEVKENQERRHCNGSRERGSPTTEALPQDKSKFGFVTVETGNIIRNKIPFYTNANILPTTAKFWEHQHDQ